MKKDLINLYADKMNGYTSIDSTLETVKEQIQKYVSWYVGQPVGQDTLDTIRIGVEHILKLYGNKLDCKLYYNDNGNIDVIFIT